MLHISIIRRERKVKHSVSTTTILNMLRCNTQGELLKSGCSSNDSLVNVR